MPRGTAAARPRQSSEDPAVQETLIGLAFIALTALWFYYLSRKRYRCPFCARGVKWDDQKCPHCGSDMEGRHRVGGPESRIRAGRPIETPRARRSRERSRDRRG